MKRVFSLRRHPYVRRLGMLLIVVALIAAIVSCARPVTYNLAMAANPAGGGTATDIVNKSPYQAGRVVRVKAVAAAGYEFAGWSAPAGGFLDANAEETNFTMPAQDITVTANFEATLLDHFRVYNAGPEGPAPYLGEIVELEDQFGFFTATVGWGASFGNPVEKVHDGVTTPISDPDHHIMGYWLEDVESQYWRVTVSNQFGDQELTVYGPTSLAVPAQKEGHDAPEGLGCFLGYQVIEGPSLEVVVGLSDQFGDAPQGLVLNPIAFGNPVRVTHNGEVTEIVNPDEHFVAYIVLDDGASTGSHEVVVTDQFGEHTIKLFQGEEAALIVPSEKITWEQVQPPLDHFRVYNARPEGPAPYLGEIVELEDQFGSLMATVGWGPSFGNPVEKVHDGVTTPISDPDHHIMGYYLEDVEPQYWRVTISNQFGDQELTVYGPNGLSVPAQKEGHDAPEGLGCFLGYQVIEGPSLEVVVGLSDQFGDAPQSLVLNPIAFGNPVRITHNGEVTEIVNPDAHFVAYIVLDDGASTGWQEVVVTDQFGEHTIKLFQGEEAALIVPSEKISWEPL